MAIVGLHLTSNAGGTARRTSEIFRLSFAALSCSSKFKVWANVALACPSDQFNIVRVLGTWCNSGAAGEHLASSRLSTRNSGKAVAWIWASVIYMSWQHYTYFVDRHVRNILTCAGYTRAWIWQSERYKSAGPGFTSDTH